jgi:hypothetical protein
MTGWREKKIQELEQQLTVEVAYSEQLKQEGAEQKQIIRSLVGQIDKLKAQATTQQPMVGPMLMEMFALQLASTEWVATEICDDQHPEARLAWVRRVWSTAQLLTQERPKVSQ